MTLITPQDALNLHQNGKITEALSAYEQLLADTQYSNNDQIWFLHGGALSQLGKEENAVNSFHKATQLAPQNPYNALEYANSLLRLNRNSEALPILIKLHDLPLAIDADNNSTPEREHLLFSITYSLARCYEKLCGFKNSLKYYQQALVHEPNNTQTLLGLGSCYNSLHDYDNASNTLKSLLANEPNNFQAMLGIATSHIGRQNYSHAQKLLHQALVINPEFAEAYDCLSFCAQKNGEYTKALELSNTALKLAPNNPEILYTAANLQLATAQAQRAAETLQKAVNIAPCNPIYFSKLLLSLHYFNSIPQAEILSLHKKWAELHKPQNIKEFCNIPKPYNQEIYHYSQNKNIIRIGFISPDFCQHPVAFFILPVIKNLIKAGCTVNCYSNTQFHDQTTQDIIKISNNFIDIKSLSDYETAELIHSDQIDLLIDLAGHTPGNRLGVFFYKPAPKSATYLGYPNTTGLDCIDYRIVDEITDHTENAKSTLDSKNTDLYCSERIITTDSCFITYQPPSESPAPTQRPHIKNDYITFGSFNNIAKLSFDTVNCWVKILSCVPDSRLVLKSSALSCPDVAKEIASRFTQHGIEAHRITCLGKTSTLYNHFEQYSLIDIALDTFPYNGTTTTFDALWMGVPVICLQGQSHHSRVSSSILNHLNLDQLICKHIDEYILTSIKLASDPAEINDKMTGIRKAIGENSQKSDIASTILALANT